MIPQDKAGHMLAGICAFIVFGAAADAAGYSSAAEFLGLAAALLAGAIKEASDYVRNWLAARQGQPSQHTVDLLDFLATAAGGLLGLFASLVGK